MSKVYGGSEEYIQQMFFHYKLNQQLRMSVELIGSSDTELTYCTAFYFTLLTDLRPSAVF
jgi:hypothetical protein